MKQISKRIEKLEVAHRGPTSPDHAQPLYTMTPEEALAVADILLEVGDVELLQMVLEHNQENKHAVE